MRRGCKIEGCPATAIVLSPPVLIVTWWFWGVIPTLSVGAAVLAYGCTAIEFTGSESGVGLQGDSAHNHVDS